MKPLIGLLPLIDYQKKKLLDASRIYAGNRSRRRYSGNASPYRLY